MTIPIAVPKLTTIDLNEGDTTIASKASVVEQDINLAKEPGQDEPPAPDFPSPFYCHKTQALMKDPVVGSDGESYESSSVLTDTSNSDENAPPYYPNRALQSILQEALSLQSDSIRASWMQIQHSVSQSISQILPESATETFFRPLNDAYYCPITFNLMHEPVIDPEGNTFERVAVENWIRVNGNSPITRTPLTMEQLYPNNAIARLLDEEKEKPEEKIHPSIRKWKEEPAPMPSDIELGGGALLEQQRQQGDPVRVVVTTVNGSGTVPYIVPYPTTPRQWTEREEARRRRVYHTFGLIFAAICLAGFVLYGGIFFLMLFTFTIMVVFSKRRVQ